MSTRKNHRAAALGGIVAAAAMLGAAGQPEKPDGGAPGATARDPAYVLDFKMKRLDGTEEELAKHKGKVVVIVNVASKCGYTPQYRALEELYQKHKGGGLVVLGFPSNDFGRQEPGTSEEIATFCSETYGVTFPLFEKISVKGEDRHPLYKRLASQPEPIGGEPKWNFTKFVVDQSGRVVARFDAKGDKGNRAALEPGLVKKVEELLGVKSEEPPKEKPTTAGS